MPKRANGRDKVVMFGVTCRITMTLDGSEGANMAFSPICSVGGGKHQPQKEQKGKVEEDSKGLFPPVSRGSRLIQFRLLLYI